MTSFTCCSAHALLLPGQYYRSWPAEPAQEMLRIVGHDPLLSVHLQEMADIRARKLSLYEKVRTTFSFISFIYVFV